MLLPLAVEWERSRGALVGLSVAYAAACSGVVLSGLAFEWQAVILLALIAGFVVALRRWRRSAGALVIAGRGDVQLRGEGQAMPVVAARAIVLPFVVVVDLEATVAGAARHPVRIAVFSDALPAVDFRRLKLCLRAGMLNPVPIGGAASG